MCYLIFGSVDVFYHTVDDDVHDVFEDEGDDQMAVDYVAQASKAPEIIIIKQ